MLWSGGKDADMKEYGSPYGAWCAQETTIRRYIAQQEFALALEILVEQYEDAIISYCSCHLLEQDRAREVAQEIFLAAFEGLPHFRGHSSVKTWLYGIAFKKCIEVGRNRARREALFQEHQRLIAHSLHCAPPRQPEDMYSQEAQKRRVWQALRRLRVYERELLILRYLEDLTCDEIASVFKVSRRTVERHLPRAEAKFYQAYERCQHHATPARRPPTVSPTFAGLVHRV
jgi:RNA polymerase sigma-70 factor (ECF subfamily)